MKGFDKVLSKLIESENNNSITQMNNMELRYTNKLLKMEIIGLKMEIISNLERDIKLKHNEGYQ